MAAAGETQPDAKATEGAVSEGAKAPCFFVPSDEPRLFLTARSKVSDCSVGALRLFRFEPEAAEEG
eukprot:607518-Alexandrium_andersonii.AAC.1